MEALFAFLVTIQNLAVPVAALLGAVSVFATAIAHAPGVPSRLAAFMARIGLASSRFSVVKK